jgi:hypothetical protein
VNAVEEIEAAITKLTAEREAAMRGPWVANENFGYYGGSFGIEGGVQDEWEDSPGYALEKTDAVLITTLHRTIDAQLALLTSALGGARDLGSGHYPDEPNAVDLALDLARAINGVAS